jgi:FtsH-binding integral membrane protein
MIDPNVIRPEIALNDFLPIFISSALVLVFGGVYVGIYTAVKVKLLKPWAMIIAYFFWALTAYCLYLMGSLIHVGDFTAKALVVAAIGLFLLPFAVYYMQHQVHEENEH